MITQLKTATMLVRTAVRVVRSGYLPTALHMAWALEIESYVTGAAALGYSRADAAVLLEEAVQRGGDAALALRLMKSGWRPVDGGIS